MFSKVKMLSGSLTQEDFLEFARWWFSPQKQLRAEDLAALLLAAFADGMDFATFNEDISSDKFREMAKGLLNAPQ